MPIAFDGHDILFNNVPPSLHVLFPLPCEARHTTRGLGDIGGKEGRREGGKEGREAGGRRKDVLRGKKKRREEVKYTR